MNKSQTVKLGPIRAALLRWLGVQASLTVSGFERIGSKSDAGVSVDHQRMLSLSAVWGCTRLISETIATLPLNLYERGATGKRVAQGHPLQWIISNRPNPDTTSSLHWEATIAAMLLRGNARAEKLVIGGRVVGLVFLRSENLSGPYNSDQGRVWRYSENGRQRDIPDARIFHIPGFTLDSREGVSVIQYGANVFGAALAADQAANKTFANGLHPTTYFKYPTQLRAEQREDARKAIKRISGVLNAGEPAILEAGMEAGTIGILPADAQLLESRAFSVEEICRWFRVPPFMIGHAEKSTSWGSGIEQQMIGFLTFTLAPWLKRVEQAINKDLLSPAEQQRYYAKFSVEGLLRADSAGRASFYQSMVNNGILTRDEVRELEDREPMGGNASVLTVQTALAPLDQIGSNQPQD